MISSDSIVSVFAVFSAASTKSIIISVSLMSCESTIPLSSACFFGPGPLWISVACFALSIYAHYPCRLACLPTIFFGLWFFCAMLDSLDVPSCDSPSSLYGCVSFSDAPFVALSLIYALSFVRELLLLWVSMLWSFVTCCSSYGRLVSISSSIDCGLTLQVLKTLHAMTTLKMRILDYHFFCTFAFLQMQCYCIRFAFEGGVKEY
jgi:hypothetical protein